MLIFWFWSLYYGMWDVIFEDARWRYMGTLYSLYYFCNFFPCLKWFLKIWNQQTVKLVGESLVKFWTKTLLFVLIKGIIGTFGQMWMESEDQMLILYQCQLLGFRTVLWLSRGVLLSLGNIHWRNMKSWDIMFAYYSQMF